jgi:hypothetical protein
VKQRENAKNEHNKRAQRQTGDQKMFTKSKIALSVAVVLGTASMAYAHQGVKSYDGVVVRPSPNVDPNPPAASYAQAHVRPSSNLDANPSTEPAGPARPLSSFERDWFDFQNHE